MELGCAHLVAESCLVQREAASSLLRLGCAGLGAELGEIF